MGTLLEEINQLDIAERLQLVEDLWDSVASRASEFPISDAQKAELGRRLAKHREDPNRGVTLNQIAARLHCEV
jgi:putative addiction module component (TIGR02574 family)